MESVILQLAQEWERKATELNKGTCGVDELSERDTLYSCAAQLREVVEKEKEHNT